MDIYLAPSLSEILAKLKNFLRLSHLYYPVVSWKCLIDMWRIRIAEDVQQNKAFFVRASNIFTQSRCCTMVRFLMILSDVDFVFLQGIYCQKHSFLHQIIRNLTAEFSVSNCFCDIDNNLMYTNCTELAVSFYWIREYYTVLSDWIQQTIFCNIDSLV